jgi:hypothetical protein
MPIPSVFFIKNDNYEIKNDTTPTPYIYTV